MILGIHDGHNSSASLITDNTIKYSLSEERFTRKKNQRGFPNNSIEYILNELNIKDNEDNKEKENINIITVGGLFRRGNRLKYLKTFQKEMNIPMLYFNHHLCHASLYSLSDFKECLVITMDGGGDGLSSTVSIGNKKGLEIIAQSDTIDSLGDFYASITEVLGFKPMEDEGKVMSLSSYECGGEVDIDIKVIDYDSNIKSFKNYLGVIGYESTKALRNIFHLCNINLNSMDFRTKVLISKYAQKTLENTVLKMIEDFSNETGIDKIVFSGGVAQNVLLNKKIGERYDLYVPPFMGDEGLSVGSALLIRESGNKNKINDEINNKTSNNMKNKINNKKINLKNTYLGYKILNKNVETLIENNLLKNYKVNYIENRDIPEVIGNYLINNGIVCLCRGRMEFGPRALGNRSIIALPSKENKERINRYLKRNSFMPFAPTILYEYMEDYLINPKYNPFMTALFDVNKNNIERIRGVVHVDNTTRAQILKREFNSLYYDIINYLYDSIDLPVVLNTSFNIHGEPIVCNELDGVRSFKFIGDVLLLGNWLIEKI
ncbi:hypothetical protein KKP91_00255 [Methanothermococcus sp. SCGC AD-155-M21]|nr:hypothetical protein [Methanothermococcus sp. SCGC AD-155-M21]